jgi:hypothetical protein
VTSFSSPNKDVEYMNNFCRRSYNDRQTSTWCKVIQRGNNKTSFTALNFIDIEIRKPTYSGGETELIHKMQNMNIKKGPSAQQAITKSSMSSIDTRLPHLEKVNNRCKVRKSFPSASCSLH